MGRRSEGKQQMATEQVNTEIEIEKSLQKATMAGQVKAATIKKMQELVDKHPDKIAGIIRTMIFRPDEG